MHTVFTGKFWYKQKIVSIMIAYNIITLAVSKTSSSCIM